jgi:hypothetical protein
MSGANHSRRTRRLMLWYPRRWRERYGEEYTAHMEQEFADKPHSFHRSLDVAINGTRTRLTSPFFQQTPFLTLRVGLAAASVITLALLWNSHFGVVSLDTSYEVGTGSASTPGEVAVFPVSLGSNTHDEIRLLGVKLIPLPGYSTPKLVDARLSKSRGYPASELSWPLKASSTTELDAQPIDLYTPPSGFGTEYAVYGVVGTRPHTLYATEGVSITYTHNGTSHSANFYWATTDCVVRELNAAATRWCDAQSHAAFAALNADLPGIHANTYFRHGPEM